MADVGAAAGLRRVTGIGGRRRRGSIMRDAAQVAFRVRCTLNRNAARAVALLAVVLRLGIWREGQARAAAEQHELQHQRSDQRSSHPARCVQRATQRSTSV